MTTAYVTNGGEQLETSRSVLFSLSGFQNPSFYEDLGYFNGTGSSITHVGSEYVLTAGPTTANGTSGYSAVLETAKLGRFAHGMMSEACMTVRFPVAPTAAQGARWGYFTNDTSGGTNYGLSFYYGSTGLVLGRRSSSGSVTINQSQWIDKLDGTGTSGVTIDMTLPNQFVILTDSTGYAEFMVRVLTPTGYVPVTIFKSVPASYPGFFDPCFPIMATVYSNDSGSFSMNVGGRSFSVLGDFEPTVRNASHGVLGTTGITAASISKPLVSIRRSIGANTAVGSSDTFNNVGVYLTGFDFISTQDCMIQILQNGTLTGASYGAVGGIGAGETAMEADTSATAITSGTGVVRYKCALRGSGNSGSVVFPEPIYIARKQVITLSARMIASTGTTSASVLLKWYEEW